MKRIRFGYEKRDEMFGIENEKNGYVDDKDNKIRIKDSCYATE